MSSRRRGSALVEVAVALVLLASLVSIVAQSMVAIARHRRAAESRQLARLEAANVMEQVAAHSWDELTNETLSRIRIMPPTKRRLPGALLSIAVSSPGGELDEKRLVVELTYQLPAGQTAAPVRLVAWRYK